MSKWIDVAELLQKLISAKEVIPIQGDLITLQNNMFSLQAEQMKLLGENTQLRSRVTELEKKKVYPYEKDHTWKVHPERPDIRLCPVCLDRDGFENPMVPWVNSNRQHCSTCKKVFE